MEIKINYVKDMYWVIGLGPWLAILYGSGVLFLAPLLVTWYPVMIFAFDYCSPSSFIKSYETDKKNNLPLLSVIANLSPSETISTIGFLEARNLPKKEPSPPLIM